MDRKVEKLLLGTLLLDNDAIDLVLESGVKPYHFRSLANALIFEAFVHVRQRGIKGIDCVTVAEELSRDENLDAAGGIQHLTEVVSSVPYVDHYGLPRLARRVMSRF